MRWRRLAVAAAGVMTLAACDGGAGDARASDAAATDQPVASVVGAVDPTPAPAIDLEFFDGETASLADLTGEPLILNFWASWCGPCVQEMPDLQAVASRRDDVRFIGINTRDNPADAAALIEETGVTYDLARDPDGAVFQTLEGRGMPTTIFIDEEGRIVGRHTGVLTETALEDRLDGFFGA